MASKQQSPIQQAIVRDEEKDAKIERLTKQLEEACRKCGYLKEEHDKSQEALEEARTKERQAEKRVKDLESTLSATKIVAGTAMAGLAHLGNKLTVAEEQLESTTAKMEVVQKHNEKLQARIEASEDATSSMREFVYKMKNVLDQVPEQELQTPEVVASMEDDQLVVSRDTGDGHGEMAPYGQHQIEYDGEFEKYKLSPNKRARLN